MLTVDNSSNPDIEESTYLVHVATAELLSDLFLPAVTFDPVTFEMVAVSTESSGIDNDDRCIEVGHVAASTASQLRLCAVLQDTAQEDWPLSTSI